MSIDSGSLDKLIQSAYNRFSITDQTQKDAIGAAIHDPTKALYKLIAAVNSKSAGPPSGLQPGAHAIFYSGDLPNSAAWKMVKKIVEKSSGTKYWISSTEVGGFIVDENNYTSTWNEFQAAVGPLSDNFKNAVYQIINGVASYNFASSAPSVSDVVFGTNVDKDSILLSVEIPRFSTLYPAGTWNGFRVSQLTQYDPSHPADAYASANTYLGAAMAYWNIIESDGTYVTTNVYGNVINSQSGNTIIVNASNSGLNVSMDAILQLSGNYNSISGLSNANITLMSGSRGDDINMSNGRLNIQDHTGGWAADALTLRGSNNAVAMGAVDILLVQGNNNNITAGDSSYVGVLTGSNSTQITMPHGTIFVASGAHITAIGNDLTIQISNMKEWPSVTVTTQVSVKLVEVNPDGTGQDVYAYASPAVSNYKRQSISHLADGRVFAQGLHAWDGSFAIRYFNYATTGTGWGETYIIFDTNGKAIQQVTNDRDGSAYVTVFANYSNRPLNVTYFYSNASSANAAISANDWKIQELVASNGSQAYWSGANALIVAQNAGEANVIGATWTQLPNYLSTGGALSGVSQIQWVQGLQIQADYVNMSPPFLLGNNQQTWNQVRADAGYLNNTILDPLILNLSGGVVDTTAKGENGIRFDMLSDGVLRETGWISSGEAILVNGLQTPTNGSSFTSVEQLCALDADHNGVVTAAEAGSLGIWQPGAKGSGGSVSTLQQLDIAAINLDWQAQWTPQAGVFAPMGKVDHGNLISSTFTFTYANGSTGQGADVTFGVEGLDAHVQAAAQGLIQAAAGFGAIDSGEVSSLIAAMQTGSALGVLAPPQSLQS